MLGLSEFSIILVYLRIIKLSTYHPTVFTQMKDNSLQRIGTDIILQFSCNSYFERINIDTSAVASYFEAAVQSIESKILW